MSKNIKRMVGEIRAALDAYPREQLQEILTYVFKEYVVEGGAAPAQGAMAMLEARTELEGLTFAELVTWLQLHLDVPELAQFDVQGERVTVRAAGRAIPIEAARQPEPVAPVVAPPPVAATAPAVAAVPTPAAAPTLAPASSAPASMPTQPSPTAAPKQSSTEEKKEEPSSRFSWLEVD